MRWVFIAIFVAILAFQVLVPPIIGLANNGDFGKVAGYWGLGAPSDLDYKYVSSHYSFDPKFGYWAKFLSSDQPLAWPAIRAHDLVAPNLHNRKSPLLNSSHMS